MTNELLPCPFCGGKPVAITAFKPFESVFIDCQGCDISSPIYETLDEARATWNRRA